MASEPRKTAQFRFYEELNDFLPPDRRKLSFPYGFIGTPSVKDAVEAIGVPHTEVDLVVVNGQSVGWSYRLQDGDRVGNSRTSVRTVGSGKVLMGNDYTHQIVPVKPEEPQPSPRAR